MNAKDGVRIKINNSISLYLLLLVVGVGVGVKGNNRCWLDAAPLALTKQKNFFILYIIFIVIEIITFFLVCVCVRGGVLGWERIPLETMT